MRFIDTPLYWQHVMIILFIFALVLAIFDAIIAIKICKKYWIISLSLFSFVLSFITIFLTMRGSYLYRVNRPVFEPSFTIIKLPFIAFAILALVLLSIDIFLLIYTTKWRNKNLSLYSIKESFDTLPSGIVFYDEQGLVSLINKEMNKVSLLITGRTLLNGNTFWNNIMSNIIIDGAKILKIGEEPIIELENGKIMSLKRNIHSISAKKIYEIIATDITSTYTLTKELEIKLDELEQVNKRLVSYGESISKLTREKEVLMAKIRIHDDMGKILLTTKHKLSNNMLLEEKEELFDFWKLEIDALKSNDKREKKNNLQVIKDAAKMVGVKIEYFGDKPKSNTIIEKILVNAMHECLTNTVMHANGKRMKVIVENNKGLWTIKITNDGKKPQKKIVEGGGLTNLRYLVEQEFGKMVINSNPYFELTIEIKGEISNEKW